MEKGRNEKSPLLNFKRRSTYEKAGFLSKLFFCFAFPYIWKGRTQILNISDIHPNLAENDATALANELEIKMESSSVKNSKFGLVRSLLSIHKSSITVLTFAAILRDVIIRPCQGILLGRFIRSFKERTAPFNLTENEWQLDGLMYGALLVLTFVAFIFAFQHSTFVSTHVAMKMRVATATAIYRKCLGLTQRQLEETGAGKITNMMTSEVSLIDWGVQYTPYVIVAPLSIIISTGIIWTYVGAAGFIGLGIALLIGPLQAYSSKLFGKLRGMIAKQTDSRLRMVHDLLNGMMTIKMSVWESPFSKRISDVRKEEMRGAKKKGMLYGVMLGIYQVSPKLALFATLVTYVLLGSKLDAETAFVTLTLLNSVASVLTNSLPYLIVYGSEVWISLKRIQEFLKASGGRNGSISPTKSVESPHIRLDKVSAKLGEEGDYGLRSISLDLLPGMFICVCGTVGSGKSSLLNIILGELSATSGNVEVEGKIAYASQIPSIFPGTVQDNILFGKPFESGWYDKVITACALRPDFALLPYGDKTLVADKGVTLSGGQKSRISLARAVYCNADIYLLDDPMSSVDASVGRQLHDNVIRGLIKSKCVLLVTHLTQHCREADEVLLMDKGEIRARGTYNELYANGLLGTDTTDKVDDVIEEETRRNEEKVWSAPEIEEEWKADADIGLGFTWKYLSFRNGIVAILFLLILSIANQIVLTGSDYFLKTWTGEEAISPLRDEIPYIVTYAIFMIPLTILPFLRSVFHHYICFRSAEGLHISLLSSMLSAPMSFFETNPRGRILSRFSKDMRTVDEVLPLQLLIFTGMLAQVLAVLILAGFVNVFMVLPAISLLIVSYCIRKYYLGAASSAARIEAKAKSPAVSHLSASLNGLTTIRAYNVQSQFETKFSQVINVHSSTCFFQMICGRWIGTTVQCVALLYFIALTIVFLMDKDIDAASVGVVMNSATLMSSSLANVVSQLTDMENQSVSVENILEYIRIQGEEKLGKLPPVGWPSQGSIKFSQVGVSYIPGKNVLNNISFQIQPGEKIGIVGRTGAGKTSLVSALFRLMELNHGSIHIDGIDISKLSLRDLRSSMSIVAQDPVLFSSFGGTLRNNLNPCSEYEDGDIHKVLRDIRLNERISEFGLEAVVADDGSNFSHGERQIISLGRALLKKTKILILDEATAHVDSETGELIQKVIKERFENTTIITIAHRLGTILSSDRVCVMEAGRIIEFDSPATLLARKDSRLSELLKMSNKSSRSKDM